MTVEEKLQHFYDVAVGEAQKEADEMLEKHQQILTQQFESHKQEKRSQAEQDIKAEVDHAKREVNKALSSQQLIIKRDWTKRQTELKDKLFVEVKDKLEAFMASPEYEKYLTDKILAASELAAGEEIRIYVTPADESRIHSLTASTGLPIEVAGEPFMGGIKAVIPGKNILIDYSFLDSFIALRRDFTFDGGLHHE
ncbi:MAG: V-type ATP synthase subunit E [Blautia sp.]|jgi:V/A-type H+-transporting ATPase subunit E